jgi:hypothetical protein
MFEGQAFDLAQRRSQRSQRDRARRLQPSRLRPEGTAPSLEVCDHLVASGRRDGSTRSSASTRCIGHGCCGIRAVRHDLRPRVPSGRRPRERNGRQRISLRQRFLVHRRCGGDVVAPSSRAGDGPDSRWQLHSSAAWPGFWPQQRQAGPTQSLWPHWASSCCSSQSRSAGRQGSPLHRERPPTKTHLDFDHTEPFLCIPWSLCVILRACGRSRGGVERGRRR